MRSAALRKMVARSAKGSVSQADLATMAESMAEEISAGVAVEKLATGEAWSEGFGCF